ncbi:MAG: HEAT repeat domain-containing protein [Candidatus Promineifilaceae bacterium]
MITSADEFKRLRESSVAEEYRRAAHEEASIIVWHEVLHKYPHLAYWVVHNKTVPIEILEILSSNHDRRVRDIVASKRKLPEKLMMELAQDEDEGIRHTLVYNAKITKRVLEVLVNDSWDVVRNAAKEKLAR